ncbi:hypothetical protein GBA52_028385 [Prunus armeniaca]|nr:hypothetical protein GBA52_028385 [Prunus armeniaca]
MERAQDYLRCCLQVAQDNGFLDLIHNYKYNNNMGPQPGLLSPTFSLPMPALDCQLLLYTNRRI